MRILTLARDLRRRKAREKQGLFVVEGIRAVEELLGSAVEIVGILAAPQLDGTARGASLHASVRARGALLTDISERDFGTAAETESPQGVLAVARIPERMFSDVMEITPLRLLVLDAVQDPGNVGTILRTAAALGASATVALPGTVDLWNAKVVRSAMGAHFRHLAFHCTWEALNTFLRTEAIPLWAADAQGEALSRPAPDRVAIAVGNEGSGLSAEMRQAAARTIALPISSDVESLNVAVAAGILLYEMRP